MPLHPQEGHTCTNFVGTQPRIRQGRARPSRGRFKHPVRMQAFLCDLLDALASTGIRMPAVGGMPECIWHNPNRRGPCLSLLHSPLGAGATA